MKRSLLYTIVTAVCLFTFVGSLLLYSASPATDKRHQNAYCADCIKYAMSVNGKIRGEEHVRGNAQFFKYALDVSCRGSLLTSGRCLDYHRKFLKDSERYMQEVEDPYKACKGIKACQ